MKETIRAIKFILFSISAGVIEFGTFTFLNEFTNLLYYPCYLIALILSVIWNFTLNKEYTFKSSANIKIAMLKVFIYYLIFTPISTLLGNYLVEKLLWNEYLVTILNMIVNLITEFLYQRYVVYKNSVDTK